MRFFLALIILTASYISLPAGKPVVKLPLKPVLVVKDKNENRIHIIGVSHGAVSSSKLVEEVIRQVRPSAVALELCDDRFIALALDSSIVPLGNDTLKEIYSRRRSEQELRRAARGEGQKAGYSGMLASLRFVSSQGLIGGVFVCLGLAVSALQRTARSWTAAGSDGVHRPVDDEFTTAMRVSSSLDIPFAFLADASQNDTLRSLSSLFSGETFLPADVFSASKQLCFSAFGKLPLASDERLSRNIDASALIKESQWVSIPQVYREDENMLKSLYPVLAFLFVTTSFQLLPAVNYEDNIASLRDNIAVLNPSLDAFITSRGIDIVSVLDSISFLADMLYVLLLIRMTKLIGADRDVVLATNVQALCAKLERKDVVVVLGMLHCNGVARYLLTGVRPSDLEKDLS